ncbi:hypothetical protein SprV_0301133300 [Sparganum proliferum]
MAHELPKNAILRLLERLYQTDSKLHIKFTATDLLDAWDFFDIDKDGVLMGEEYELFIRILSEIQKNVYTNKPTTSIPHLLISAIAMKKPYQIGVDELSRLLSDEERFLFLFRKTSNVHSSFDFMRVWREFDHDGNGVIDSKELEAFLEKLVLTSNGLMSEDKIKEFAAIIIRYFDRNNDGTLQLSEMSRLLPTKKNIISNCAFKEISEKDLDRIFDFYDQDHNGVIENAEFEGLVKDIIESVKDNYELKDLEEYKNLLLQQWDENADGKISKDELKLLLLHDHGTTLKQ